MKRHTNSPASVLAQLKNIAKANNVVFAEILNRYAIERILKRIELSSRANQCILKGGCLFILWSDGFSYRPTMDADLEIRGRGDIGSIAGLFHEVARIVPVEPDGISIDEESIRVGQIRADDEYGGVRALMIAHNADKQSQWNAFVRKSRLTGLTPEFLTVVATIRDFYSKIIGCVK